MMQRRAFSYMEATMVILIAGIVAIAVLPAGGNTVDVQVQEFARRFEADVAYAQSLSIADPSDPAVVKMNGESQSYWVARKSNPDQPVTHPRTRQPYVVKVGPDSGTGLDKLTIVATNFGDDGVLTLLPEGGTSLNENAVVQIEAGGEPMEITRQESTGAAEASPGYSEVETQPLVKEEGMIQKPAGVNGVRVR